MISTYKFNHRFLDHINTGWKVYMPALNWALRESFRKQTDEGIYDTFVNPAEIYFTYSIDYTKGEVTVSIFRKIKMECSEWDPLVPMLTNTEKLPCHAGGQTVVESVMGTAARIDNERPEEARITAAANVVQVLEGICVKYLQDQAAKITSREYGNSIYNDRYQLCYEDMGNV